MGDSKPRRSVRCPHCAGPLAKEMETSDWTLPPLIRDSFSMIGSAVGCTTSAFYGFNHVMPIVQRWVKGPLWLHFLIGAPPVIVFSSACAGLTEVVLFQHLPNLHLHLIIQHSRLRHCHLQPHRMIRFTNPEIPLLYNSLYSCISSRALW
ncbi:unnamed protein product [Camellia sinensis]